MATLKMPTIEYPPAENTERPPAEIGFDNPPTSELSSTPAVLGVTLDGPIGAALASLLEGLDYAQDLQATPWDFAVELSSLRRLKLSNNDLRWLHARGLIEHAIEIDASSEATRAFRTRERVVFGKRSCFVLTPAGATLAREVRGQAGSRGPRIDFSAVERSLHEQMTSPDPPAPHWDRDRHELRIGQTVVKRFTVPSFDQESVLAAFEEQHWPARIDDPLMGPDGVASRLPETVRLLNHFRGSRLICFQCEGSRGVLWQYGEQPAAPRPQPLLSSAHAS